MDVISKADLDIDVAIPEALVRVAAQNLIDLSPWHILPRQIAIQRMHALRERYSTKYVPFARRQDNDDLACLEPSTAAVVIVHDFSSEGSERRESFATFWDWFRAAVEDMIAFE